MNLKRLLHTPLGQFFISVLLGLGLATFFRKVCNDKNCIDFNGPIIGDFEEKVYKYDNKCYKYTTNAEKCDANKKILDIRKPPTPEEEELEKQHVTPKLMTGASPVSSSPSKSSFLPW